MCPNSHETADFVTFTGEILNGKLYFSCNVSLCLVSCNILFPMLLSLTSLGVSSLHLCSVTYLVAYSIVENKA